METPLIAAAQFQYTKASLEPSLAKLAMGENEISIFVPVVHLISFLLF